VQASSLQWQA